jgi:hypothetical protein
MCQPRDAPSCESRVAPGTPLAPSWDGVDGVIGDVRMLAWIVVVTTVGAAPLAGCGADREEDEQQ